MPVQLDDDQKEQNQDCVQKRLFDTVPWLKFTLVADKPESDHDVGHVPLRADQARRRWWPTDNVY